MKVRIWSTLLALALALCLVGCSGGGGSTPSGTAQSGSTAAQPQSAPQPEKSEASVGPFVFQTAAGQSVSIDENMAEVRAALGEEQSYFEAASCAFEGLDKTYTYPGFVITTRPEGEQDYVNSILLTDDSATTAEGIYIGSDSQAVKKAYGEGEETVGGIVYRRGGTSLNFVLEEDKVISIEYLPA